MTLDSSPVIMIVSYLILTLTIVYCGAFTLVFFKKRFTQPFKSRSPGLVIFTAIGYLISTISLCGLLGFGSFHDNDMNMKAITVIIPLIISEVAGIPLVLAGYICRAIQLIRIYTINADDFSVANLYMKRENKYHHSYYIKRIVIFLSIIVVMAGAMTWGCFKYQDTLYKLNFITLRNFLMVILTIIANYIPLIILSVYASKLIRQWERQITMNKELIVVIINWVVFDMSFHALMIYFLFYKNWKARMSYENITIVCSSAILILRNLIGFTITVPYIVMNRGAVTIIQYGETRECMYGVSIALSTEMPYLYFSKFIERKYKNEGLNIISFYTKVKRYEDMITKNAKKQESEELANEIISDFKAAKKDFNNLDTFDTISKSLVNKSYQDDNDTLVFDELNEYSMQKLKKYFEKFKGSNEYKSLYNQLLQNEIIYQRLCNAMLL